LSGQSGEVRPSFSDSLFVSTDLNLVAGINLSCFLSILEEDASFFSSGCFLFCLVLQFWTKFEAFGFALSLVNTILLTANFSPGHPTSSELLMTSGRSEDLPSLFDKRP